MSQVENGYLLIKYYDLVIHKELTREVTDFHLEDINMDCDYYLHAPDSRQIHLIEYFRHQKMIRSNRGLKYLTLSAHSEPTSGKLVFNLQLQKQLVNRFYRTLPNPVLVFTCSLESQPGSIAQVYGRLDLRELITAQTWTDNCDFHNATRTTSAEPLVSKGTFNLSVTWKESVISSIQISSQYFMETLFEDEATKDLTLVAGNSSEIKCHRIIFSAHSPVFSRMLSSHNPMKEAISGRFEMPENSEEGVRTLIKYLYGMPMIIEDLSVDVAVELFQTAHKYDLSHLEGSLLRLFMKVEVSWFTPDAILELYLFVEKLDVLKNLRERCLELMTSMDMKEFQGCEEFKKLETLQSMNILLEMVTSFKKRGSKSDGLEPGVKSKGGKD